MEKRSKLPFILRFLRTAFLIELALLALVGLVHWLAGWRTAFQYGGGVMWAGFLALVIGAASLVGQWGFRTDTTYQISQTVSEADIHRRGQQTLNDLAQDYEFLLLMTIIGLVAMAAGSAIQNVFPVR